MKLLTKMPSAWMIYLPATSNKPGEWLNLATVDAIVSIPQEDKLQVIFSSGKIRYYSDEQYAILIANLCSCSGMNVPN
jgi:hypothetical protein